MLCSRQTFVSVMFVAMLIAHSYIVSMENKNNGDKFYCIKFMQVADEKLIINKLGPNSTFATFAFTTKNQNKTGDLLRSERIPQTKQIYSMFSWSPGKST